MKTYICLTFCAIVTRVTRYADTPIPLTGKTSLADRITRAWLLYANVLYKKAKEGKSRLCLRNLQGGKGRVRRYINIAILRADEWDNESLK